MRITVQAIRSVTTVSWTCSVFQKYAALLLRSQEEPEQEIVMEPTTEFSRGDNKGNRLVSPFMVLTNCDYIEVEMYGKPPGPPITRITGI